MQDPIADMPHPASVTVSRKCVAVTMPSLQAESGNCQRAEAKKVLLKILKLATVAGTGTDSKYFLWQKLLQKSIQRVSRPVSR